jgi:hypothetical protein
MKNKKILGMPFAVFLIGLVIIGGASAMLAGYLSNTATMNVEVKSPMSIQFADVDYVSYEDTPVDAINAVAGVSEEAWEDDLNVPSTTGLGKVELGVKLEVADSVVLNGKAYVSDGNHEVKVTFATAVAGNVTVKITACSGDYSAYKADRFINAQFAR